MVLARLDDMKAEDILTIDLRNKSSIGDYMVVSSGRSQRHVGSVADRIVEDLHKVGIATRVEGTPHCDWVLIDAGDSDRSRVSAGSPRLLQSGRNVDRRPRGQTRELAGPA